jgi:hypothetical protein
MPLLSLASVFPILTAATMGVDDTCAGLTDVFAQKDCRTAHAARASLLRAQLPKTRFLARGTLRARPFDFARGTYTFALTDIEGDEVHELLRNSDLYLSSFLPEPREHVFPTVAAGTLRCQSARIEALEGVYDTIVLDAFTMTSAPMSEADARESSLRDATLSVEIVGRLEQVPMRVCCGVSTTSMVKGARAPCSYAPFRFVVEEARADGLPVRGFAKEPEVAELPPEWTAVSP